MDNFLTERIHVIGISGSLRKGSYNRALLRAAQELAPDGMEIRIFDNEVLASIPLFNEDLRQQGEPKSVYTMKVEIENADALLFTIPEYNHSISGVLKNAIDWASRPPNESPLKGKPVAIMGASTGISGTIRAQMHFRQVCVFTDMLPVNTPQVFVSNAAQRFDSHGTLIDEDSRKFVRQLLESLLEWTRLLRFRNIVGDIREQGLASMEIQK